MDIISCQLPAELLHNIFGCLNRQDIRATRQVCKTFNARASPFLIRAAWISTQWRDLRILEAISRHEIFSKSVQEIIYDISFYQSIYSQTTYLSNLKSSYLQNGKDNSEFKYSRAMRGYTIYRERVNMQNHRLRQPVEYNATQSAYEHSDVSRGFEKPDVLPNQSHVENDLTHLTSALRLMPAVRKLTISCRRYKHQCLRYQASYSGSPRCDHRKCCGEQRNFSMESMNDGNLMAAVINPSPFSKPCWNRALAVLDLAHLASRKVSILIHHSPLLTPS